MNVKKFLIAVIVVGVVMNVYDFVVNGVILSGPLYSKLSSLFNPNPSIRWLVIADFVGALVLVWVFDRVYGCFGGSVKGGAQFGIYAGVLANFPTWIICHLLINGFTYKLAWFWTVVGIIWCVIAGALAGALYKK